MPTAILSESNLKDKIVGRIFDIQRFAVHDGPGIRTTVFFKGCSNRCGWCHNPESITSENQIQYYPSRCVYCGNCGVCCPQGCHVFTDYKHVFDRSKCRACGLCTQTCYVNALVLCGRSVTVDDVMEQIVADIVYYQKSGGGVTLSGGEPVLQNRFCLELLKSIKALNIHTIIQTAGNYDYIKLKDLLPYVDLVMYDIKAYSENIYRTHIHGDRDTMFNNLIKLDSEGIPIIVRTPVVGSVNDTADEIMLIVKFLQNIKNLKEYVLIPYHGLGKAKYESLGKEYRNTYYTPGPDVMLNLKNLAAQYLPVPVLVL
ncbi:MAG: pyruvate formate lyase activating enzyme [Clostridiales bacterium]|uniref:glycyl-radical enzyme activating protein n=1 Tax=Caldicoprobacter guelmensis TaxID=1170224 RepID=UPI001958FD91|nr:glycyl-radical enzyme activating protein [Caldicoprobacter guelmensis]MDN5276848.1 pyruvate formate lyase activating enzyme [Clostridiales bacterium]